MLKALLQLFRGTPTTQSIGLWGNDVGKMTSLLNALKTGKYEPKQASIHPALEDIEIDGVIFRILIPSAHGPCRLFYEKLGIEHLAAFVYVIDDEDVKSSREDLEILVESCGAKPVLVLSPSREVTKEAVGFYSISLQAENIAFFNYSASSNDVSGAQEGLQWLKTRL